MSVTKTLVHEGEDANVEYSLTSGRSDAVTVRLVDRLPVDSRESDRDGDRLHGETVDVTWRVEPGDEIELSRHVPPDTRTNGNVSAIEFLPWLSIESDDAELSESVTGVASRDAEQVTAWELNRETVLAAIPAHEEEDSIGSVVEEALKYADSVLVVDDGSTDETADRAREAGALLVEHSTNRGYGGALQTIFEEAHRTSVDYLVILDADGQHDPSDIPRLIKEQRSADADFVIGNRFGEGSDTDISRFRWFGLAVINVLTNVSLGRIRPSSRVRDTQSGFRAYSKELVESLAEDDGIGEQMGASTDILKHVDEHGYEIAEVGTTIDYSVEEPNSTNPVVHGYSVVKNILNILQWERPISVLGVPGLVLTGCGLGVAFLSLQQYFATGSVSALQPVGSAALILAGVVVLVAAVVLHSLNIYDQYGG